MAVGRGPEDVAALPSEHRWWESEGSNSECKKTLKIGREKTINGNLCCEAYGITTKASAEKNKKLFRILTSKSNDKGMVSTVVNARVVAFDDIQ